MTAADNPINYRLRSTHTWPVKTWIDQFGGVWMYTRCCGWVFA